MPGVKLKAASPPAYARDWTAMLQAVRWETRSGVGCGRVERILCTNVAAGGRTAVQGADASCDPPWGAHLEWSQKQVSRGRMRVLFSSTATAMACATWQAAQTDLKILIEQIGLNFGWCPTFS